MRGYFGIGIFNAKTPANLGTLWRHAYLYDAAYIFTIGARYPKQACDTARTPMHVPLFAYDTFDAFFEHLPHGCPLVGVELDPRATPLSRFHHPERACYLLGAEDHGLPPKVVDRCHSLVQIEAPNPQSMNVAVAGSLLMYNRHMARQRVPA